MIIAKIIIHFVMLSVIEANIDSNTIYEYAKAAIPQ